MEPPKQQQIDELTAAMERGADALRSFDSNKEVTLIYHNDTDGLSSGSIMAAALSRLGRKTINYCMEQIYPRPLSMIYKLAKGPVIIMDLGVGKKHEDFIRKSTKERPTIIIDHHGALKESIFVPGAEKLFDVNCTKHNISGDSYASASTLTYLFAEKLCDIKDFAHLAVLGAYSDQNHMRGEEKGYFPKDGLDNKVLKITGKVKEENKIYKIQLTDGSDFLFMEQVFHDSLLLGMFGYKQKFSIESKGEMAGPDIGQLLLTEGYKEKFQISKMVKELMKKKEEIYAHLEKTFARKSNYLASENIIFFDASPYFKGLGVKAIGDFCGNLAKKVNIAKAMYVMCAHPIESVPFSKAHEISPFDIEDVLKISIRSTPELQQKIAKGQSFTITKLLEQVNPDQVGSSHEFRGATIITREKLQELLSKCEACIQGKEYAPIELPELELSVKS